jgi:hypothetical protein
MLFGTLQLAGFSATGAFEGVQARVIAVQTQVSSPQAQEINLETGLTKGRRGKPRYGVPKLRSATQVMARKRLNVTRDLLSITGVSMQVTIPHTQISFEPPFRTCYRQKLVMTNFGINVTKYS